MIPIQGFHRGLLTKTTLSHCDGLHGGHFKLYVTSIPRYQHIIVIAVFLAVLAFMLSQRNVKVKNAMPRGGGIGFLHDVTKPVDPGITLIISCFKI